jgi:hypothetical protein
MAHSNGNNEPVMAHSNGNNEPAMAHSNGNQAGGNTRTARETPNTGSKAREGRPRYSPNRSNARNIKKNSPVRRQDVYKKSRTKKCSFH